jgi:hypothetical protein
MNGDEAWSGNDAPLYVSAYRHIHDLFVAAGATNVVWAWCPNVTAVHGGNRNTLDYYPGDSYVDWTGVDGYNKFIPYYFHPETTYNVALTQSEFRTKISVGSNPWSPRPRTHNIAEICERYGGGGHAVVGAVSLKREQLKIDGQTLTATTSCTGPRGVYQAQGKIKFGYDSPGGGTGFGNVDGIVWKFELTTTAPAK